MKELMKPKIISAIVDILPETILELKASRVSTSSKVNYSVRFLIDSFVVHPNTTPISYQFKAVLRVYDSIGDPVSQLLVVSPDSIFESNSSKKLINTRNYYSIVYDEYDASGRYVINTRPDVTPFFSGSFNLPNAFDYSLIPDVDMIKICKRKILEIRKMVKQLKESGRL